MKPYKLGGKCPSCDKEGTISEITVNAEGVLALTCLCILCGQGYFEVEFQMVRLIAACAILDCKPKDKDLEMLEKYVPVGKPN